MITPERTNKGRPARERVKRIALDINSQQYYKQSLSLRKAYRKAVSMVGVSFAAAVVAATSESNESTRNRKLQTVTGLLVLFLLHIVSRKEDTVYRPIAIMEALRDTTLPLADGLIAESIESLRLVGVAKEELNLAVKGSDKQASFDGYWIKSSKVTEDEIRSVL